MFNEAVTIATMAVQHRKVMTSLLARLWDRLRNGHRRVFVFGAAGSGKSSLGRLLAGEDLGQGAYRESTEVERYDLDGNMSCTVLVPPGQERLREATWPGLEGLMASGPSVVVHVVDYGLDEVAPLSFRELEDHAEGMTARATMEAFARRRRAAELEPLRRLHAVPIRDERLRLVTVVGKQDLWWRWREDVRRHYSQGAYAAEIDLLREKLGEANVHHTLWSSSSIIKNLADGDGEMLLPTTEGYDEPRRLLHEERLLEIVAEAAQRV